VSEFESYIETVKKLRAELAAAQAELKMVCQDSANRLYALRQKWSDERAAHAETRKALEKSLEARDRVITLGEKQCATMMCARASETALRKRVDSICRRLSNAGGDISAEFILGKLVQALTADPTGQEGERG
jgi:hypothetical protein